MTALLDSREGDLKAIRAALEALVGGANTDALEAVQAAVEAIQAKVEQQAAQKPYDGIDSTPFVAVNTTDASDTTYREIKAAVAGKRHWIDALLIVNKTAAETPVIQVAEDTGGTPVVLLTFAPGDPAVVHSRLIELPVALTVTAAKNIGCNATTATGDTVVFLFGRVED